MSLFSLTCSRPVTLSSASAQLALRAACTRRRRLWVVLLGDRFRAGHVREHGRHERPLREGGLAAAARFATIAEATIEYILSLIRTGVYSPLIA